MTMFGTLFGRTLFFGITLGRLAGGILVFGLLIGIMLAAKPKGPQPLVAWIAMGLILLAIIAEMFI